MTGRSTVSDLRALKGKRQILTMHVDNALEAAAAAQAGMDMFTFEVDHRLEAVRAAAPGIFIQAGCRQSLMASEESAIREGFRAMERGVDGIYFAGSLRIVEAMAREGIPVTGHVGYVPLRRTWTGVRAMGKTPEEAATIFQKVKALEDAGAWAVEMEIVPVEIADFITRNTSLITEGMGCGSVCDTQYLFSCDVLGTNTGHIPRHAKKYANIAAEEARLQEIRVAAFKAFAEEAKSGYYPEKGHEINVGEDIFRKFLQLVKQP